jgi:hypothetical protein
MSSDLENRRTDCLREERIPGDFGLGGEEEMLKSSGATLLAGLPLWGSFAMGFLTREQAMCF